MARVEKMPVSIPKGVEIAAAGGLLTVKGGKKALSLSLPHEIGIELRDGAAHVVVGAGVSSAALGGTVRALLNNMVIGVTRGFEKRLTLVGVGYRAQMQGRKLNLSLGFSHPVEYAVPEDVTIETPSQTEIVVKGADKHIVGQVAADIRGFRPPEPYKGKGVRYADERVILKEAKKK
ncbi:MAG: 50S ribosomal protein L6 [Gammaproteobacteria bacterium]|nr:50S ribosomal protein L6 [Gammaproteobacteria bacterium]